ncbi:MAG: hypothetical protein K9L21_05470 [Spirochaetia bacterium]|nr:hypothetical protein [Spirochaetia bacterium]
MGLDRYFTQSMSIYRKAAATGAWGHEPTFQQVGSCNGWIQGPSGKLLLQDGKPVSVATVELYCPVGTDIQPRDEILCEHKRYRVLWVTDAAGMGHHLEVSLEEIP